jgi:hypothetical protein
MKLNIHPKDETGNYLEKDPEKVVLSEVTITQERYEELLESEEILNALYAGGVDNWQFYENCFE